MTKLPTINIKGKEYVMVKDRIVAFNELYPKGAIDTEKSVDGDIIVFKATVTPDVTQTPPRTFTGHSEAIRGQSGGITGQSPIEVAETSAVGRALAMLGIGIIESVASDDEVNKTSYAPAKGTPLNEKQINFIQTLWTQKGVKPISLEGKSSFDARGYIDRLMKLPDTMSMPKTPTTPDDYMEMSDEQRGVLEEENRATKRKSYQELPVISPDGEAFDKEASIALDRIANE